MLGTCILIHTHYIEHIARLLWYKFMGPTLDLHNSHKSHTEICRFKVFSYFSTQDVIFLLSVQQGSRHTKQKIFLDNLNSPIGPYSIVHA